MSQPVVSICIPTYNRPAELRRLLDSVFRQNFTDFEVIVTDDSPEGEARDVVTTYKDSRLFYYRNVPPLGSPANWNAAMSRARGQFIKLMHDDDWFADSTALHAFVQAFSDSPGATLAFCVSEIRQADTGAVRFNRPDEQFLRQIKADPREVFYGNLIGAPSAVIFRNAGTKFDERLSYLVDIDFYIRLLQQGGFVFIDRPLIMNTAGNPDQVTAKSFNSRIQIGENIMMYNRHFRNGLPSVKISSLFIRLFRAYELPSFSVLHEWGVQAPEPGWYFRLLWFAGRSWRFLKGLKRKSV